MHFLNPRHLLALAAAVALPGTAGANIVLSQVVVDISPSSDTAQDVEITNDGSEVAYVVVEPSELVAAGLPGEKRVPIVDPGQGGLLVSPQRMILQPGERKVVRIAAIAARGTSDRIYRVTVKPVSGPVSAQVSALKLLVGYDMLVIFRPVAPAAKVVGTRDGGNLTLRNDGNTNVELFEGKQCDAAAPTSCKPLPSKRLYAGQVWQQPLAGSGPVQYRVALGSSSTLQKF
jgi:P pilus assembly chaperone PapD